MALQLGERVIFLATRHYPPDRLTIAKAVGVDVSARSNMSPVQMIGLVISWADDVDAMYSPPAQGWRSVAGYEVEVKESTYYVCRPGQSVEHMAQHY